MTGQEATAAVILALNQAGTPFMVVGSFSRNYYAFPRSTNDADIVIHCDPSQQERLFASLPPGITADPQASFEMVTGTRRLILSVDASDFKIELFTLSHDPHDRARFERKVAVQIAGFNCFLPTAEDVIIQKLRWSRIALRAKDYEDARDVTAVQGRTLDLDYIREWADQHGTRDLFEEIYRSVESLF